MFKYKEHCWTMKETNIPEPPKLIYVVDDYSEAGVITVNQYLVIPDSGDYNKHSNHYSVMYAKITEEGSKPGCITSFWNEKLKTWDAPTSVKEAYEQRIHECAERIISIQQDIDTKESRIEMFKERISKLELLLDDEKKWGTNNE